MQDTIVRFLAGLLAALVVVGFFGITVFVHELGHFVAARACGMRVDVFSIGFGPAIFKWRRGTTVYKICWIPLGGYVALPQLDPSGMERVQGKQDKDAGDGQAGAALEPAAWWKRIFVSLAGPCGNIVFATLVAVLLYALPPVGMAPGVDLSGAVIGSVDAGSSSAAAGLRVGDQVLRVGGSKVDTWDEFLTECHLASGAGATTVALLVSNRLDHAVRPVAAPLMRIEAGFHRVPHIGRLRLCGIGGLLPDMPAQAAGLRTNDLLVALDGQSLYGFDHFTRALQEAGGRPIALRVLRGRELHEVTLTPALDAARQRWVIGAIIGEADLAVPMWMHYRRPWRQIQGDLSAIGRVLRALVAPRHRGEAGRVAQALSGPIVILATMWLHTLANLLYTIGFVRFLNVNLAVINLLPLPVLDGGHIVFALYEGITRRKVHPKVLNWLVNAFALLLIGIFILISVRDTWLLTRLFGRRAAPAEATTPPAQGTGEGTEP